MLTKARLSAINGVVMAVLAALVSFGVVGGNKANAVQGIIVSVIAFAAAVGVRSALPPK